MSYQSYYEQTTTHYYYILLDNNPGLYCADFMQPDSAGHVMLGRRHLARGNAMNVYQEYTKLPY